MYTMVTKRIKGRKFIFKPEGPTDSGPNIKNRVPHTHTHISITGSIMSV